MFVAVQYPFADARRFLPLDTHRLARPVWPNATEGKEFIRGYGAVQRRRRGGIDSWPGERLYCETAASLRFDKSPRTFRVSPELALPLDCAFRRFFTDGAVLSRFEIGFSDSRPWERQPGDPPRHAPLTGDDCSKLVAGVVNLPVRVLGPLGDMKSTTLGAAAPLIAERYLAATTAKHQKAAYPTERWWYTPGVPLVVVEYREGELSLPRHVRLVTTLDNDDIELAHGPGDRQLPGTWFLRFQKKAASAAAGQDNPRTRDLVRRLRIHLVRLHAEREVLKAVLHLVATGQIPVVSESDASAELAQYLEDSEPPLSRDWRNGLPQGDILKAAYEYDELVTEGERADLLASLKQLRRSTQRKVAKLISPPADGEASLDGQDVGGSPRRLSGAQVQALQNALLDAFPTWDALEQMTYIVLEESLERVAGRGDLEAVAFRLITRAHSRGHLQRLIDGAVKQNPDNPLLLSVQRSWQTETV